MIENSAKHTRLKCTKHFLVVSNLDFGVQPASSGLYWNCNIIYLLVCLKSGNGSWWSVQIDKFDLVNSLEKLRASKVFRDKN